MPTVISAHHIKLMLDLRRDELKKNETRAAECAYGKWRDIYLKRVKRSRERIAKLETELVAAKASEAEGA